MLFATYRIGKVWVRHTCYAYASVGGGDGIRTRNPAREPAFRRARVPFRRSPIFTPVKIRPVGRIGTGPFKKSVEIGSVNREFRGQL